MNLDLDIKNYKIKDLEKFFKLPLNYTNKEMFLHVKNFYDRINSSSLDENTKNKVLEFINKARNVLEDKTPIIEPPPIEYVFAKNEEFVPGIMNPIEKRVTTKTICIDTLFRPNYNKTKSTDYTYVLPISMNKVISMQMTSFEIPNMWNAFSCMNKSNTFEIELFNVNCRRRCRQKCCNPHISNCKKCCEQDYLCKECFEEDEFCNKCFEKECICKCEICNEHKCKCKKCNKCHEKNCKCKKCNKCHESICICKCEICHEKECKCKKCNYCNERKYECCKECNKLICSFKKCKECHYKECHKECKEIPEKCCEKYINTKCTITIPEGNYMSDTFQTAMNNIFQSLNVPGLNFLVLEIGIQTNTIIRTNAIDYGECPYDPNNKYHSPNFYFKLNFAIPNQKLYKTAGWMMGFRQETYIVKESFTSYIDDTSIVVYKNYIKSESSYGSTIDNYIFLEVNDFNNNYPTDTIVSTNETSYLGNTILARIALMSGANTIVLNSAADLTFKKREYFGPIKLEKLHIRVLNRFGDVLDLRGNDYSFVLEIKQLY